MTDPIPEVLSSCQAVVADAARTRIDDDALERFVATLAAHPSATTGADDDNVLVLRGSLHEICNYCLLSDALNFCFWSPDPWTVSYRDRTWTRTPAMVASLLRAIERDADWLTPDRWARATRDDVLHIFAGTGMIPLPDERARIMRETGRVLLSDFDGGFENAVRAADADALALARLIATRFDSFRDVALHRGRCVAFLKRAQICAADLHRTAVANGLPGLTGLDKLTVFADYRLPQLFRDRGILVLDADVEGRINRGELIEAGSQPEVEIRAATVVIADRLVHVLREGGMRTAAWRIDYALWKMARQPDVGVAHHRTITTFY